MRHKHRIRRLYLAAILSAALGGIELVEAQPRAQQAIDLNWTSPSVVDLERGLEDGRRHGIDTGPMLAEIHSAPLGPARDAALTKVALAYANSLAHGAVEPRDLHDTFGLGTNAVDVEAGLADALRSGRIRAWLEGLAPQDAEYRALSQAYLRYAARQPTEDVPLGPLIKPGTLDPRVVQVAAALVRLGYLGTGPAPQAYVPRVVQALRRFQEDSGLAVDGVIGPETLSMLNKGPADRARQLAVNLERRRWLVRDPPSERIDVNLAAGELKYIRDGQVAWTSRVVAGTPRAATPLLEETFEQIVINPPWYVPQSIAQREILPKGADYLQTHDMYVENGRVIQRPGPGAALGQVKFDMQNRHAIYLHDTPAKSLFERQQRFFSHGCVRVENALEFARILAEQSGKGEDFDAAMASGNTKAVNLGRSVSVRLLYRTAFVDQAGNVAFRLDPYGLDDKVAEALGLGESGRKASVEPETDLGP